MSESATMLCYCPHCGKKSQISQVRTPGGVDDDGGWVLKCSGCANPFRQHVGRDIQMSRVIWGASVLETYDDNVAGSRNHALEKYRLSESLHFAESAVILGVVRARSVHKVGYGHNCNWAAA